MTGLLEEGVAPDAPVNRAGEPAPSRRLPRWLRGRVAKVLALLVVVTACVAPLVALNLHRNPSLSPYDEPSYLDYLYRVDHGRFIVGKGDHLTPYTMHVIACRGVVPVILPNRAQCDGKAPLGVPPLNTADIDPPTYYIFTAIGAKVIRSIGITHDFLLSGRLMGIAWGAIGLTLLILFIRRLGGSWLAAAIAAALVLFMPEYLRMWTFVTPHAMELIVTVSVLWVTVNWAEGGGRWWHLALVGLVPPAVKATDVLATCLAVLVLLFFAYRSWAAGRHARERPLSSSRRCVAGAGILFGVTLLASVVWLAIRSHYSIMTGNEFPQFNVSHFSLSDLTSTLALFLQPQAVLTGNQTSIAVLVQLALFGSAVAVLRSSELSAPMRPLAGSVLVGGIFGPWLFVLFNYVVLSQFVTPLPIRYGLSVFSAAAVVVGSGTRSRLALAALAVLCLLLLSIDLLPTWP